MPLHVTCPQTSRQTFVKSFWEACNKAVLRKNNWSTALPKWVNHMRWIINSCLSTKRLPCAFLIVFGFLKQFDLLQTTFPPASILRRRPWRPSHRAGDGVTRMCKFWGVWLNHPLVIRLNLNLVRKICWPALDPGFLCTSQSRNESLRVERISKRQIHGWRNWGSAPRNCPLRGWSLAGRIGSTQRRKKTWKVVFH